LTFLYFRSSSNLPYQILALPYYKKEIKKPRSSSWTYWSISVWGDNYSNKGE